MILIFEYGKLGNQLFQLYALRKTLPNHKILCFGFWEFQKLVNSCNIIFIPNSRLATLVYYLLFALTRLRILSAVGDVPIIKKHSTDTSLSYGLFPNIFLSIRGSYFQSPSSLDECLENFPINLNIVNSARCWFRAKQINYEKSNLVFVHVRRGDYLLYPNRECPAILSLAWYLKAINFVRGRLDNPLFIAVSDDVYYLNDVFAAFDDVIISTNDYLTDFSIMTQCTHGILSASTYAFWAAYYSNSASTATLKQIFVAPLYWTGHRAQAWRPPGFQFNWITYLPT